MKPIKKILRHKPKTRAAINDISLFIGSEKAAEMLDEISEIRNRTAKIISEKNDDGNYDHWYFYNAGVNYNSEIRSVCNRYRVNHIRDLENKRVSDLSELI